MQIPQQTPVLIIGAGPSGMTTALALHRAGVTPILVDKRSETHQYSQAAILWPRTLEVLDLLGIADRWRSESLPLRAFNLDLDGHINSLSLQVEDSSFSQPWAVGQNVTESLLDAALHERNIPVFRSTEVIALQLGDSHVEAKLRLPDGSTLPVQADWVVGSDGSGSIVRETAGIARAGNRHPGIQLIQGDVRLRGPLTLERDIAYLFSSGHESMLVMPQSPDGHFRVLLTIPDDGEVDTPDLADLEARAQHVVPGLELYDPTWLNRFRVQHQLADTYHHGRAFVVGDAAHVWVPVGGQGMNIAMQDALDLGWKLGGVIRNQLPPSTLDSYTAERLPVGRDTIAYTERAYSAVLEPASFSGWLQRHLLPKAISYPVIDTLVARRLSQFDLSYPASHLVEDHGSTGGPKAGERAPDASVNCQGQTLRLADFYRKGDWLVLLWDSSPDAFHSDIARAGISVFAIDTSREGHLDSGVNILRDIGQLAKRAFGVTHSAVHVIRPDGIIGYRGAIDVQRLRNYLNQNCLPAEGRSPNLQPATGGAASCVTAM